MKVKDIVDLFDSINIQGDIETEFNSIQYDSRKCTSGCLFIAIKGENVDGHKYLSQAIENGAVAVMVEDMPDEIDEDVVYINIEYGRSALAAVSHHFYDYPAKKMKVYGVTGTNGKTTIAFLLKSIFDSAGYKTGLIGTTGIIIEDEVLPTKHTTPEALELCKNFDKMVKAGVKVVIMEVSSHALSQSRVQYIKFDGAMFTNITHEHLDYHISIEEYAKAKKLLFKMLDEKGIAVSFADDKYGIYMLEDIKAAQKYLTGRSDSADVQIINENIKIDRTEFELNFKKDRKNYNFTTQLPGLFNIENAAIAASLAHFAGVKNKYIKEGLENSKGAPGRMERVVLSNGAIGIVDYAHTPDALDKALRTCRDILIKAGHPDNKLIVVFGCGGDRDKEKRPIMGKMASEIADIAVITNDNPRTENPGQIVKDILKGVDSDHMVKTQVVQNREEAVNVAYDLSKENDIIIITGKGHETYQIIGTEEYYFNDVAALQKFSV